MLLWCHSPIGFLFSFLLLFRHLFYLSFKCLHIGPPCHLLFLGVIFSVESIFISKLMSLKSVSSPHRSCELQTHISQMCHHRQAFTFLLEHSISPFPPFSPSYCPGDIYLAFPDPSGLGWHIPGVTALITQQCKDPFTRAGLRLSYDCHYGT